jgi:hypothetical protein
MDSRQPIKAFIEQMWTTSTKRCDQQLPQPILEALQKLIEARSPPETISFVLGIDIEQVRKLIAKDPKQLAKVVETISDKSRRYRCVQSNRLMNSPVFVVDGNYYEHCIFKLIPPSLASESSRTLSSRKR